MDITNNEKVNYLLELIRDHEVIQSIFVAQGPMGLIHLIEQLGTVVESQQSLIDALYDDLLKEHNEH